MSKVIGIDLGTTNSCVSIYEGGEAKVIPNKEGKNTTPSIVAFTDKGEVLVGDPAKRQAITNPEKTIYSIKRIMGLMLSEEKAKEAQSKVGYKIVDKNGMASIDISGKIYTPQEISAKILSKLKIDTEEFLGEKITDAVITVPAYFNDEQRKATKEAGTIAGLNVLRIINEPTSASLAYGLDKKEEEKVLVYDLGGGTFDVTVLEIGDGTFEVLSTDGNAFLGGDDFDNRIIDWLSEEFKQENGFDIKNDKMALQRLKDSAENAKKELSSAESTEINLPFISMGNAGPIHLVKSLTRAKFEAMTEDLVSETLEHVKTALEESGVNKEDIKEIIMVGGSTRLPKVNQVIKEYFGKDLNKGVNPDEVVAAGASIQGGVLKGDVKDVLLLDVTPLSLGLETLGGVLTKIIDKGTTIPVKKSQVFSTAEDNQPAVSIHICQGEREFAQDNKSLGTFELSDIPAAPRGVPQIEVTFDIDANGILNVSAKDKGTGKENTITVTGSSGLSNDEIDKMVQEAEANKEKDKEKKEIIELRNKIDSLINEANKNNVNVSEIEEQMKNDNLTKGDLENLEKQIINRLQESQKTAPSKENKKEEDVIDAEVS